MAAWIEPPARLPDDFVPPSASVWPQRELIEDQEGAPLPPELQRGGAVWQAIRAGLSTTEAWTPAFRDLRADEIAQRLAPVLWPWLPSSDLNRGDQA